MVEIHLEDIARVERLLRMLKQNRHTVEEIAREVIAVPNLARRLTHDLHRRRGPGRYSVAQAITLLGTEQVKAHIKDMLDHWLNAVERPGAAQIVGDPAQTPIPRLDRGPKSDPTRSRARLIA